MSEWTNQWKSIIFIKWENQLAKKKQKKISKTVEWHWQFIVIMINLKIRVQYNKNIKPNIADINTIQTHP